MQVHGSPIPLSTFEFLAKDSKIEVGDAIWRSNPLLDNFARAPERVLSVEYIDRNPVEFLSCSLASLSSPIRNTLHDNVDTVYWVAGPRIFSRPSLYDGITVPDLQELLDLGLDITVANGADTRTISLVSTFIGSFYKMQNVAGLDQYYPRAQMIELFEFSSRNRRWGLSGLSSSNPTGELCPGHVSYFPRTKIRVKISDCELPKQIAVVLRRLLPSIGLSEALKLAKAESEIGEFTILDAQNIIDRLRLADPTVKFALEKI